MSWILALAGFSALIVLHEAGHFLAAKAVGMRVERFSLFFGRTPLRFTRGETEYGIGWIPLGGFVKITGMTPAEEVAPEHLDQAYFRQAVWKRVVVIAAGPAVNVVLGIALLWAFHSAIGPQAIGVTSVERGTPAASVLRPGDEPLAVNGRAGDYAAIGDAIAAVPCAVTPPVQGCRSAEPVRLDILRDGRRMTVSARTYWDADTRDDAGKLLPAKSRLGWAFGYLDYRKPVGFVDGFGASLGNTWDVVVATSRLPQILLDPVQRKEISGPVGNYEVTRQSIVQAPGDTISYLGIISLSLALINLLPFLPLDGGHIVWALAEKVRRGRPLSLVVMERFTLVGFALVILLMGIGMTNDIGRIVDGTGFSVR